MMTAWRPGEGEADAFHEEVGNLVWDGDRKQLLRGFMVPRGVLVNAGGDAEAGSETHGILSNLYLDEAYKTKKYILDVDIQNGQYSYKENSWLWSRIDEATFDHTDQNTLQRV